VDLTLGDILAHIFVFNGKGDGTFNSSAPISISSGSNVNKVILADFNNDQKMDLSVTAETSTVSILLGDGSGNFTSHGVVTPVSNPFFSEAASDFNSDGKIDLALTTSLADQAVILLGDGMGNFANAPSSPMSFGVSSLNGIVVGDFDNNMKQDLAIGASDGKIRILLGNGNGTFNSGITLTLGPAPLFFVVDDFDKDGNMVPDAVNLIKFNISGDGFIAGTDNGLQTDLTSFKSNERKAFNGLALAVVESNGKTGNIKLVATSDGISSASIDINAK
jgi:hypothetical protein